MPAIPVIFTTDLLTLTIKIEGTEIPADVGVISTLVVKEVNRIPFAKVVLQDGNAASQDFPHSNSEDFIPGKEIEILAGYDGAVDSIFKGIIIKHGIKVRRNGESILTIDCKDKASKLTIGRKSKYFYESSDSDAINEIISSNGLEMDIEDTDVAHPELVQYRTTDWDFILTRAEVNGKICITNEGKIEIKNPDLSQEPISEIQFGTNLRSFEAGMDARDQQVGVSATSWDYSTQENVKVEGESPDFETGGNIDPADLADVIGLEEFELAHGGRLEEPELQAWADAQILRNQLAKVQGKVTVDGHHQYLPGTVISLAGLGERFNGNHFVSGVRHEIRDGIWVTDIQFGLNPEWFTERYNIHEAATSGLFAAVRGLQIGIVTQLQDDPNGNDRILIRLPIINPEEQGIWARMASLDAGENRGAFFRPEIGDEVIVGFINEDPNEAIVLGMLNSAAKPAPISASDDNHEKGFFTRSEMKLLFDDDKKSITISNAEGNRIEVKESSIEMEDSNGNKITMDSDGIKVESAKDLILSASANVTIESGAAINISAGSELKAEGGATAELSAGATTTIKGALVQIN